jgi:uncharacterized membrane protein YgcG
MTRSKLSVKTILLMSGIGLAVAAFGGFQPAAAQSYSNDYSCPTGYVYDPSYGCTVSGYAYEPYDYGYYGYQPYYWGYGSYHLSQHHEDGHGFGHGMGGGGFGHGIGGGFGHGGGGGHR